MKYSAYNNFEMYKVLKINGFILNEFLIYFNCIQIGCTKKKFYNAVGRKKFFYKYDTVLYL